VVVDNEAPVPTCSFGVGTNVTKMGSKQLKDLMLEYSITENCGGPLSVKVETFSNELENDNTPRMAVHFQSKADLPNENKVGVYVS